MHTTGASNRLLCAALLPILLCAVAGCATGGDQMRYSVINTERGVSILRRSLAQQRSQLERMEKAQRTLLESQARLNAAVDELLTEVKRTQGQLEVVRHYLEQSQGAVIRPPSGPPSGPAVPESPAAEAKTPAGPTANTEPSSTGPRGTKRQQPVQTRTGPPPSKTERETGIQIDAAKLFSRAQNDYSAGNYGLSLLEFQQLRRFFQGTVWAEKAAYWIGQCHAQMGEHEKATSAFAEFRRQYPHSELLADAMLGEADSLVKMGRKKEAAELLKAVVKNYPNSPQARSARKRLHSLGSAAQ